MSANLIYFAAWASGLVWFLWHHRDKRSKQQKQSDDLKESLGYEVK